MEEYLVYFTAVLFLGITAQWLATRLRMPSILLLLAFGFLAGRLGGIDTNRLIGRELLFAVVSLSVAVILFEGGLTLRFSELKQAGGTVLYLVTVGVVVSCGLTAFAASWLLDMDWRIALLTGSILVVTGPTVIAPLLRQIRPERRIGSIIKWEGIVIDPIGAVLAVLVFQAVLASDVSHAATAPALVWTALAGLAKTAVVGTLTAVLVAELMIRLLKRYWIPDFLHASVFLAVAVVSFVASNAMQKESGLVTVTLLGVLLANQKRVALRHVVEFKENLRVLLISCLFIVLASRIELNHVVELGWGGAAFLATLVLVVRPLAVWISTIGRGLGRNERIFLALLAPRGIVAAAVSSIFALEVAHRFGPDRLPAGAESIVPVTFLVIVGTVTIYGLTAAPLARRLKLASGSPQGVLFSGADAWVVPIAAALAEEGFPVLLVDSNYRRTAAARMAGVPSVCANVLSEFAAEELDLGGIGRLLAVSPNEEVNALVAMEYKHVFGRGEVYQLAAGEPATGRRETVSHELRGRRLFGQDVTYAELALRYRAGAQVKKTQLTEEFTLDDFHRQHGTDAIVLFLIGPSGHLTVRTADTPFEPEPGQTVVALV